MNLINKTKNQQMMVSNSERPIKHGCARKGNFSPEYKIWLGIIKRCRDINDSRYGGRGITICDRWKGKNGFANFLEDMGKKPSPIHSIDRFPDNNGNYCRENCRWATPKEQALNRRSNLLIEFDGISKPLTQWCEEKKLPFDAIRQRIVDRNWPVEKAFTHPFRDTKKWDVKYKGEVKNLIDWCRYLNIKYERTRHRIKYLNWSIEKAFESN